MSYSTQSFGNSDAVFENASFGPTVDWFVAKNVSLGVRVDLSYGDSKGYGVDGSLVDTKSAAVHVGPRVGVNLPLGRAFSFWPPASLGFEWVQETQSVVSGSSGSVSGNPLGYPSSTNLGPWIELDAALLWHLQPHLFLGVVPGISRDFGHVQGGPEVGGQETHVSAGFVLGGWFGGPPRIGMDEAPPPAPSATTRRFGQAGEFVLSNELVLRGYWTGYAGSSSTSSGGSFAVGLDHFLADHVSIGASVTGYYGTSTGIDATTSAVVSSQSEGGALAARAGVDIPLGGSFSFWPHASLGVGEQVVNQQEGGRSREDDKIVSVGVYAPFLVHPTTHFFLGLGPSASHDLSRAVTVAPGGDPRGRRIPAPPSA